MPMKDTISFHEIIESTLINGIIELSRDGKIKNSFRLTAQREKQSKRKRKKSIMVIKTMKKRKTFSHKSTIK